MKSINGELIYTGGNIYIGFGQTDDGNWFISDHCEDCVRIVNANPNCEESWDSEWQQEHLVADLNEGEDDTIEFLYSFLKMLGTSTSQKLICFLINDYPQFFEKNYSNSDARSIGLEIKEMLKDNKDLLFIGLGGMMDGNSYDIEYELTNGKMVTIQICIK